MARQFKPGQLQTGSLFNISSSYALTASNAQTASYLNTLNQNLTFNGNLTLNGTASISYLNVAYETASVIYSSGSNQFGDAANDTQTLYGNVIVPTGSVGIGTTTPSSKLDVSGSARITDGLTVTGSAQITGSLIIQGNSQVSGSLRGQVTTLSVTSGTASINMSTNNFFTLTLLNSINGVTHINPTNINPGQTANIRITQSSTFPGSISFPSSIKQASGSAYTASAVSSAVDIITLIAFDASTVYVSAINRMI